MPEGYGDDNSIALAAGTLAVDQSPRSFAFVRVICTPKNSTSSADLVQTLLTCTH